MNFKNNLRSLAISSVVVFSIAACGGSGSGSSGSASLQKITGVWGDSDQSEVEYTVIDSRGQLRLYDYQGDGSGTGENCYLLDTVSADILSMSVEPNGSNYNLVFTTSEFTGLMQDSISLNADSTVMSVWEIDEDRSRVSSDGTTVIMPANKSISPATLQRVQGVDEMDLTLCDGSSGLLNDPTDGDEAGSDSLFGGLYNSIPR